mgnify:CR=1 FL=1
MGSLFAVIAAMMAGIFLASGIRLLKMRQPGVAVTAFVIAVVFVILAWMASTIP